MTAYCIFDVKEVHDHESMGRYQQEVVPVVESFGGRYVVVGGPWEVVEGAWRPSTGYKNEDYDKALETQKQPQPSRTGSAWTVHGGFAISL